MPDNGGGWVVKRFLLLSAKVTSTVLLRLRAKLSVIGYSLIHCETNAHVQDYVHNCEYRQSCVTVWQLDIAAALISGLSRQCLLTLRQTTVNMIRCDCDLPLDYDVD